MATTATLPSAPVSAFLTNLTEAKHIQTLQHMTNFIISQESPIPIPELQQSLTEDIQLHIDRVFTVQDLKDLIRRAEKSSSRIRQIEDYENSIRKQVAEVEQHITSTINLRRKAAAIRQQNKDLYDAYNSIGDHFHSPLVNAQHSLISSFNQMKSHFAELKRKQIEGMKEEKERVKKMRTEEKKQEQERMKQEKAEKKQREKEAREAAKEAEKENLRAANKSFGMLSKAAKAEQRKKDLDFKQLQYEVMSRALGVLTKIDLNLSTGAAVPHQVAALELIGDDDDFDNIEEQDEKEEMKYLP